MKGNIYLNVILALLICSGSAIAQQTSSAQSSLQFIEVTRGMARETVLSGLAGKYRLQEIDHSLDIWAVYDESGLAEGQILFEKGKVSAVIVNTLPPLTGDAVKLARELFNVLYFHANLPEAPTDIDKVLGTKKIVLSVALDRTQTRDFDEQRIMIGVGKTMYRIIIDVPIQSNTPANVSMEMVR